MLNIYIHKKLHYLGKNDQHCAKYSINSLQASVCDDVMVLLQVKKQHRHLASNCGGTNKIHSDVLIESLFLFTVRFISPPFCFLNGGN